MYAVFEVLVWDSFMAFSEFSQNIKYDYMICVWPILLKLSPDAPSDESYSYVHVIAITYCMYPSKYTDNVAIILNNDHSTLH